VFKRVAITAALAASLIGGALTSPAEADQVAGPGVTLPPGAGLSIGGWLALMQTDGNFVIYANGAPQYSTRTFVAGSRAVMQTDGNFVIYTPNNVPVFNTGTFSPDSTLVMQADGNLVIYSPTRATWSRTTGRIPGRAVPGNGVFLVPQQVPFGTYIAGPAEFCYWETDDAAGNIIDNDIVQSGQVIMTVPTNAVRVSTSGCATFFQL
jgi:hypothetical protein